VSKKTDLTTKLLAKIQPEHPLPEPLSEANLLEQGLYAILLRKLTPAQAKDTVVRLRNAYKDWNELRICQAQEINGHLDLGSKGMAAAADIREYLQEVFQRSHGMELEFLRDDVQGSQRFVSILPFIGMGTAHYLLWLASKGELPVTPALMRVLDRVGLVSRTASPKKARAAIEPIVPNGKELEFAVRFGEVASRWCDARKPLCHQCVLVDDCKHGKKAFRDWKIAQERLEQQRAREAARLAILQKKEDEKRKKEEEKRKKREALEADKRAKEASRLAKIAERKKAEDAAKAAKLKAVADAKAEAERVRKQKELEQKKLAALAESKRLEEQRRKEAERKKLEAKKAAEKKAAEAKKAAEKKALEAKKKAEAAKKKAKKK
jgi:endonuclease III